MPTTTVNDRRAYGWATVACDPAADQAASRRRHPLY